MREFCHGAEILMAGLVSAGYGMVSSFILHSKYYSWGVSFF